MLVILVLPSTYSIIYLTLLGESDMLCIIITPILCILYCYIYNQIENGVIEWTIVCIIVTFQGIMQRLKALYRVFVPLKPQIDPNLRIIDHRNNRTYNLNLTQGSDCYFIKSMDVAQIVDFRADGLKVYDSAYMNTISNTTGICHINGRRGVLEYRGYPIQELAQKSSFLQVAFLLLHGELPCADQLTDFSKHVMNHSIIKQQLTGLMRSFRHDAHPMGMLVSSIAACSTMYPQANPSITGNNPYADVKFLNKQIYRILGSITTIAANAYRHKIRKPYNQPRKDCGYVQNFMYMLDYYNQKDYKSHPKLVKAMEILFIIYAQHGMSCSTSFVRHMASSGADLYTSIAMAAGALSGPKHGGANSQVIKMLQSIGSKDNIRRFLMQVKLKKRLLFGFGNRVYKSYDPRAKLIKKVAFDVFSVCGKQPLIEIAIQLQRIALSDDFFITRKLYPNVDFYSGLIYRAMGFDTQMFPVLYAIPRVAGWLAHFIQFLKDPENHIYRPRQNYKGYGRRELIGLSQRVDHNKDTEEIVSRGRMRRQLSNKYAKENSQ